MLSYLSSSCEKGGNPYFRPHLPLWRWGFLYFRAPWHIPDKDTPHLRYVFQLGTWALGRTGTPTSRRTGPPSDCPGRAAHASGGATRHRFLALLYGGERLPGHLGR